MALRLVKVAPVTLVFCRADRTWEFGRAVITKFKSLRLPLGRSPLSLLHARSVLHAPDIEQRPQLGGS
jgi:hypothetical protein